MTLAELRADVVALACAVSAGVHGALAPAHFAEGAAAGTGFAVAAVVLATLALAITRYPARVVPQAAAALVFAGLIASYALAVTSGMPLLHPEPEAIDRLALATKAIEAIGLVAAVSRFRRPASRPIPLFLIALVACFSALAALAATGGHHAHGHGTEHQHASAASFPKRFR